MDRGNSVGKMGFMEKGRVRTRLRLLDRRRPRGRRLHRCRGEGRARAVGPRDLGSEFFRLSFESLRGTWSTRASWPSRTPTRRLPVRRGDAGATTTKGRAWDRQLRLPARSGRSQGGQDALELVAFVVGQIGHQPAFRRAHTGVGALQQFLASHGSAERVAIGPTTRWPAE